MPVTNLELPLAKVIDVVLDRVKAENNVDLLVRCVDAPESMIQAVEGELARQEIPI